MICGLATLLIGVASGRVELLGWSLPVALVTGVAEMARWRLRFRWGYREPGTGLFSWFSLFSWIYWGVTLGAVAALVGLGQIGVWLCGEAGPVQTAVGVAVLLSLLATSDFPAAAIGCWLGALLGMRAHGPAAAVVAAVVGTWAGNKLGGDRDLYLKNRLLTPCARVILAARRVLPVRLRRFLEYTVEAMLLKRAGQDYEFIHRLLRDHFAIQELRPLLYDERGQIRLAVVGRLSRQGEASFDALKELASHENPAVREAAVAALGRLPTPKVGPLLGDLLRTEFDSRVRRQVVESLGTLSWTEISTALSPLDQRLGSNLARRPAEGLDPWKEIGTVLSATLQDPDADVRLAVVQVVAGMKESTDLLLSALLDDSEAVVRAAVIGLAGRWQGFEGEVFPPPEKRRRLGGRLCSLLADESWNARATAARLLGLLAYPEGFEPLVRASRDRLPAVREAALFALARLANPAAVPVLAAALRDRTQEVRNQAAEALQYLRSSLSADGAGSQAGWEGAESELVRALGARGRLLRQAAASALGAFRGAASLDALLEALQDPEITVQVLAAESLRARGRELDPQRLLGPLASRHLSVSLHAALILKDLANEALRTQLLAWLERGRPRQQVGAALALGAIRDSRASPGLRAMRDRRETKLQRLARRWHRETVDLRTIALLALLGVEKPGCAELRSWLGGPDHVLAALAGEALEVLGELTTAEHQAAVRYRHLRSSGTSLLVRYGRTLLDLELPTNRPREVVSGSPGRMSPGEPSSA